MLGTFRLILALAVALTHAGVTVAGRDPGVIAVVCFYLISGYVMTGLIRVHYGQPVQARHFYLDRALRLWPHYLVVAAITLAWFYLSGTRTYFLARTPTATDFLNNLTILPFNYYMFNDANRFVLVPTAWSLGAELQFYFIAPLVVLTGGRILVLAGSAAVFVLACFGYLNTEWYGYRLAAGVMFMFMIGSLLYDAHGSPGEPGRARTIILWTTLSIVILAGVLAATGRLFRPFNPEVLLGLICGVPILHFLGRLPRRRWDVSLGDLAYGVFLNHLLIQLVLFTQVPVTPTTTAIYVVLSIVTACVLFHLVEKPIVKLRYALRKAAVHASGNGARPGSQPDA